jgi:TRAP-type C4-dicarboxylate transport system permease small subunit
MTGEAGPSFLARLADIHDRITRAGFYLAGACLVVIVGSYSYEVVARYGFSAPTRWASAVVSYLLCYMVFLSMPELTRARIHIFISIILDSMPVKRATFLQHMAYGAAALACLIAGLICFQATWLQYVRGISTVSDWQIPKWILSMIIPYGLLSTCIYFARLAFGGAAYQSSEAL